MSKKTENKKRILLEMAKEGKEKPYFNNNDKLYNSFRSYTRKNGKCYDEEFTMKIREIAPSWFERKKYKTGTARKKNEIAEEKKRIILKMAMECKEKPKQKTMLGNALIRYITKSYLTYDVEFDLEVKRLAPQWFMYFERCAEKRQEILEIARKGGERPNWKTELGICLIGSTSKSSCYYNLNFDVELRGLVPHWFRRPPNKNGNYS